MANVIGQRVRRREDPRFLTGRERFVDYLELASGHGDVWRALQEARTASTH